MSAFAFRRDGGEWLCDEWRPLDRALYRWVRAHGGSALLAATAAWVSLADGDGDAALPLAIANRLGMPALSLEQIDALRNETMVATEASPTARPFVIDAAQRFYLWRNHAQERAAADALRARRATAATRLTRAESAAIEADVDALFGGDRRAELDSQRLAVRSVGGRRLFVLTGGPGTGKTTTVLRMLLMLRRRAQRTLSIQIAAPTGKAAQRLVQALRNGKRELRDRADAPLPADWQPLLDAVPDADALTVHRLLGYQPWRNGFRRNARDPIVADVVVIDEASMIDLNMLRCLLDAVPPQAALILVGDADQLTSVATGSVLMDIVAALDAASAGDLVRLQHSFRAAHDLVAFNEAVRRGDRDAVEAAVAAAGTRVESRVIETPRQLRDRLATWADTLAQDALLRTRLPALSHGIEAGPTPIDGKNARRKAAAAIARPQPAADATPGTADPDLFAARARVVRDALAALAQRQLLCALREGPFGALAANAALERALSKAWDVPDQSEWYAGRAIMITHNDYAAGLFNGDVGLCLADADGRLQVWFESPRVAHAGSATNVRAFAPGMLPVHEGAFAITVHKSQGSEYGRVAVLLPPDADSRILSRQLLYTAVSRAREQVELWTTAAALHAALDRPVERHGGMRDRLL